MSTRIYGSRRCTRKTVYTRVGMLASVHGLNVAAHSENGKVVVTTKNEDRNLSPYCTPYECMIWLDGFEEGVFQGELKKHERFAP